MRLMPVLFLAACIGGSDTGATDTDATPTCDDLLTSQAGCMNDDNYADCQAKERTCGAEGLLILESCPLQFSCS